jgi:hypothetical protein
MDRNNMPELDAMIDHAEVILEHLLSSTLDKHDVEDLLDRADQIVRWGRRINNTRRRLQTVKDEAVSMPTLTGITEDLEKGA